VNTIAAGVPSLRSAGRRLLIRELFAVPDKERSIVQYLDPATTLILILSRDQPMRRRNKWASGTPMKAVGRTSAIHFAIFFGPIPGSIATSTAPILNRAKAKVRKSRLGFT